MSTKAMSKAAPKKEAKAEKKAAKGTKAPAEAAKTAKGAAKAAEAVAAKGVPAAEGAAVDPDELEEQEEAAEAAAAGSGGGGNAAALAAATGGTEMSASFKNFRHHPDMENFYRFIYENDLRHEALAIIDTIMTDKTHRKQVKAAKSVAH